MSFLDPNSAPEADADIDPATFDAEDGELTTLADQLRAQLAEIDGKRADLSKRRFEAGPSQSQIRAHLMESLSLYDDEDDPMPVGVKRILDKHVKEWQRSYRERAKAGNLPQARQNGGIADTGIGYDDLMGEAGMKAVTQQIDDWFTSRANSRNRMGASAPMRGTDPAMVERLLDKASKGLI